MKLLDLAKAFQAGFIQKKLYWRLVREHMRSLVELQHVVAWNDSVKRIEIRKNGVVLVHSGGADGCDDGIRFYIDFEETISRAEETVALQGDYEQEDFDFLTGFLRDGDAVLDVGGNAGIFSLNVAAAKRGTILYTIEPIPVTYEKMQANLALNPHLAKNIHTFNHGFAEKQGEAVFYLPGASEAASMHPNRDEYYSLESTADGEYTGHIKMQEVHCKLDTVDHFCEAHSIGAVRVLKCDVEGAERDVLRGARRMLEASHPIVYAEMLRKHAKRFGYHPNEIISYMKDLGYRCTTFRDHRLVELVEMTDETQEVNFFFLHGENHADILRQHLET